MMRSIASSDCSNTLRLSENDLQLLAGAFHPHLQRRDTRAGELRHLYVLQLLDVLEEKRLPVFGREPRERPPDGVVPFSTLGRTRERNTAERRVVAHEQPRTPRRPPAGRAAPVDQDAVEPRTKPLRIVTARERAVCPDEGVLQRLLRVLPVPEHVHGVSAQAVAVPRDQRGVGADVAGADSAHQLSVARPHVVYTHGRWSSVTIYPHDLGVVTLLPRTGVLCGRAVIVIKVLGRSPRCRPVSSCPSLPPHCSRGVGATRATRRRHPRGGGSHSPRCCSPTRRSHTTRSRASTSTWSASTPAAGSTQAVAALGFGSRRPRERSTC